MAWTEQDGALLATYRAGSFSAAAELALMLARAADAADHHPDIDLRYPGTVAVRLSTHDAGHTVTGRDRALAERFDALAQESGARC
jgi:pterin-4a-carbinolamine dehydratase